MIPVAGTRGLTRADLARNRATAPIEIDPTDGRVTLGGRPLSVEAVTEAAAQPALLPALTLRTGAQAQMSPTVKPSGNGSVGSTT